MFEHTLQSMSDIIHLLPDTIANQIAAGEVVNKPSNVVKELMENAIDAKANHIQLWVKDGGIGLIQVVDNGVGMSITDARMCFERHATSKLKIAEDLHQIRTMGFRGEAMAAIAAVAQVTLKTKRSTDEIGTMVQIDGGTFKLQEPVAIPDGTHIAVKHIFFNLPARRKFLKSTITEYHHIVAEFNKIALSNPDVAFQMYNDGDEVAHYPKCNLRQRVVQILGKQAQENLIPVNESTNLVKISGFAGKAALAKKNKPDQFLFVNNRYIKSGYFNKAIRTAYEGLIPEEKQPAYVIYLEVDPADVDINRNPQKNEALFVDEHEIFRFIMAAVKKSLGFHQVAPTIDFDVRTPFDEEIDPNFKGNLVMPSITVDPHYNPFQTQTVKSSNPYRSSEVLSRSQRNWESLYEIQKEKHQEVQAQISFTDEEKIGAEAPLQHKFIQIHQKYILTTIRTGVMLIDQKAAHERILFEKFIKAFEHHKITSQQSLFPQIISLGMSDFELLQKLLPEFKVLGFELRYMGQYDMAIDGYPIEVESKNQVQVLLEILQEYKQLGADIQQNIPEKLAKSLAKSAAIQPQKPLGEEEMKNLFNQLFACEYPNIGIFGGKVIHTLKLEEIRQLFD